MMKTKFQLLSVLLMVGCICSLSLFASQDPTRDIKHRIKGPTIKVLVLQDVEGALVEVKGSYNLYDPNTGKKLDTAFSSVSYFMHPTTDGIKWGEEFPGVFQVLIVPDNPKSTVLVQGIEYRGMLYCYQIEGTMGFVNEISLDDYVDAVVGGIIGDKKFEKEALSAIAIACRTDAWYRATHSLTPFWAVKANQVGYQGVAMIPLDSAFSTMMKETRGMILDTNAPIAWFGQNPIPLTEIQKLALDGLTAKAILAHFLGDHSIIILKND
jgi:stage II sporulation protein D